MSGQLLGPFLRRVRHELEDQCSPLLDRQIASELAKEPLDCLALVSHIEPGTLPTHQDLVPQRLRRQARVSRAANHAQETEVVEVANVFIAESERSAKFKSHDR